MTNPIKVKNKDCPELRATISYCKKLQENEIHVYKTTNTPVIETLDKVILELQKHMVPIK